MVFFTNLSNKSESLIAEPPIRNLKTGITFLQRVTETMPNWIFLLFYRVLIYLPNLVISIYFLAFFLCRPPSYYYLGQIAVIIQCILGLVYSIFIREGNFKIFYCIQYLIAIPTYIFQLFFLIRGFFPNYLSNYFGIKETVIKASVIKLFPLIIMYLIISNFIYCFIILAFSIRFSCLIQVAAFLTFAYLVIAFFLPFYGFGNVWFLIMYSIFSAIGILQVWIFLLDPIARNEINFLGLFLAINVMGLLTYSFIIIIPIKSIGCFL